MDLVVDIGNTQTKAALYKEGVLADFYCFNNSQQVEWSTFKSLGIKRGVISSVSGDANRWLATLPEVDWLVLSSETSVPFKSNYKTPNTLGLDRVALVAAATTLYPKQNVLVIDAGTCVTFDFVDATGTYFGGAISPGLSMRLKAMHEFTAKLPSVQLDAQVTLIGNSTKECMQSGALIGLASEIDGTVNRYSERFENLVVVLTGGDTKVLAPLVKSGIFAPRKFLLEGLHAILAFNTP